MSINERIRYLRKEVMHLTQQEFSSVIKLSRSNLGNIETGEVSVTDRVISSICNEFGINEAWLRNGVGEPVLSRTGEQLIADFAGDLIKEGDTFRRRLVEGLAKLDKEECEILEGIAAKLLKNEEAYIGAAQL